MIRLSLFLVCLHSVVQEIPAKNLDPIPTSDLPEYLEGVSKNVGTRSANFPIPTRPGFRSDDIAQAFREAHAISDSTKPSKYPTLRNQNVGTNQNLFPYGMPFSGGLYFIPGMPVKKPSLAKSSRLSKMSYEPMYDSFVPIPFPYAFPVSYQPPKEPVQFETDPTKNVIAPAEIDDPNKFPEVEMINKLPPETEISNSPISETAYIIPSGDQLANLNSEYYVDKPQDVIVIDQPLQEIEDTPIEEILPPPPPPPPPQFNPQSGKDDLKAPETKLIQELNYPPQYRGYYEAKSRQATSKEDRSSMLAAVQSLQSLSSSALKKITQGDSGDQFESPPMVPTKPAISQTIKTVPAENIEIPVDPKPSVLTMKDVPEIQSEPLPDQRSESESVVEAKAASESEVSNKLSDIESNSVNEPEITLPSVVPKKSAEFLEGVGVTFKPTEQDSTDQQVEGKSSETTRLALPPSLPSVPEEQATLKASAKAAEESQTPDAGPCAEKSVTSSSTSISTSTPSGQSKKMATQFTLGKVSDLESYLKTIGASNNSSADEGQKLQYKYVSKNMLPQSLKFYPGLPPLNNTDKVVSLKKPEGSQNVHPPGYAIPKVGSSFNDSARSFYGSDQSPGNLYIPGISRDPIQLYSDPKTAPQNLEFRPSHPQQFYGEPQKVHSFKPSPGAPTSSNYPSERFNLNPDQGSVRSELSPPVSKPAPQTLEFMPNQPRQFYGPPQSVNGFKSTPENPPPSNYPTERFNLNSNQGSVRSEIPPPVSKTMPQTWEFVPNQPQQFYGPPQNMNGFKSTPAAPIHTNPPEQPYFNPDRGSVRADFAPPVPKTEMQPWEFRPNQPQQFYDTPKNMNSFKSSPETPTPSKYPSEQSYLKPVQESDRPEFSPPVSKTLPESSNFKPFYGPRQNINSFKSFPETPIPPNYPSEQSYLNPVRESVRSEFSPQVYDMAPPTSNFRPNPPGNPQQLDRTLQNVNNFKSSPEIQNTKTPSPLNLPTEQPYLNRDHGTHSEFPPSVSEQNYGYLRHFNENSDNHHNLPYPEVFRSKSTGENNAGSSQFSNPPVDFDGPCDATDNCAANFMPPFQNTNYRENSQNFDPNPPLNYLRSGLTVQNAMLGPSPYLNQEPHPSAPQNNHKLNLYPVNQQKESFYKNNPLEMSPPPAAGPDFRKSNSFSQENVNHAPNQQNYERVSDFSTPKIKNYEQNSLMSPQNFNDPNFDSSRTVPTSQSSVHSPPSYLDPTNQSKLPQNKYNSNYSPLMYQKDSFYKNEYPESLPSASGAPHQENIDYRLNQKNYPPGSNYFVPHPEKFEPKLSGPPADLRAMSTAQNPTFNPPNFLNTGFNPKNPQFNGKPNSLPLDYQRESYYRSNSPENSNFRNTFIVPNQKNEFVNDNARLLGRFQTDQETNVNPSNLIRSGLNVLTPQVQNFSPYKTAESDRQLFPERMPYAAPRHDVKNRYAEGPESWNAYPGSRFGRECD